MTHADIGLIFRNAARGVCVAQLTTRRDKVNAGGLLKEKVIDLGGGSTYQFFRFCSWVFCSFFWPQ